MKVAALLSVVSGAVVATALSSAAVQMQPTAVLVSRPTAAVPALAATTTRPAVTAVHVADAARPAYVDLPPGSSALSLHKERTSGPREEHVPVVDVLTCSEAWSTSGECPGTQTEVLRAAAVDAVDRAVTIPEGVHVRVSTSGGGVQVEAALPSVPPVAVTLPRLP